MSSPRFAYSSSQFSASYDYSVTAISFHNELPWNHSAVSLPNKQYMSIHPGIHKNPPAEHPHKELNGDSSDYTFQIIELAYNIRGMFYDAIDLGESNELKTFPHDSVDIPVTDNEFKKADAYLDRIRNQAENKKLKYSVFNFLGASCASVQQNVLTEITNDTPESPLAQPSWIESKTGIIWPQSCFDRAKKIAEARKNKINEELPQPAKKANPMTFFSQNQSIQRKTASLSSHPDLEARRLSYFDF